MSLSIPPTMKALVIKAPFKIAVEERPTPRIVDANDAIVRVHQSGLCGSDLHWYRGHQPSSYNFILGHEVIGEVAEVGSAVKKFKPGDLVLAAFSTSCGECFYCSQQHSARCVHSQNFGTPMLDGAQAEYFRLPQADTTLFHAPVDIPKDKLVLLTDILPTGYQVAYNAKTLLSSDVPETAANAIQQQSGVCVVIGCGPVGLCAISAACTLFETVFATDIAPHRLESASRHGAIALPLEQLKQKLMEVTEGRGADACLEVVGHSSALQTALDLVRPYGAISSCGVHTQVAPLAGSQLYGKKMMFGRCSVNKYMEPALALLRENQALFSSFVEHKIPLSQAEENKVAKTVFDFE
ncbi:uncharacterized protein EHS24_006474 [Apiotrichum porosum]|uniref:Enoyl reductase (ER) domain-containing protein n=1 Tax=Apiotrichum porosum TaxID=105984 RepID=A0A427Y1G7_9TREE|nr:uncharacterized protein EHS24_006474 [Apiotrichum porosum]RSH84927.1 hypothetical protein EHS24_006474 [Apiotrichum porosum]